jgi:hypothetical protein
VPDLETAFDEIARLLSGARGRANAVTIAELTARAGLADRRTTEQILEERFNDFPFVLVAGAPGYWIPVAGEAGEINRYRHSLHSRHRRLQVREQTLICKAMASGFRIEGERFVDPPGNQGELFA